jgi:hypothetical protein
LRQGVAKLCSKLADVAFQGLGRPDGLGEGAADLDCRLGANWLDRLGEAARRLVKTPAELGAEAQRQGRTRLRQQLAYAFKTEDMKIGDQPGRQRRTNHPGAPTDFPAPTKAAPSGATEPALDLRGVVERVMITQTTIEIEIGQAIAGEDQDRILMIPWTPPSPYRRGEIILGEGDQSSTMRPII